MAELGELSPIGQLRFAATSVSQSLIVCVVSPHVIYWLAVVKPILTLYLYLYPLTKKKTLYLYFFVYVYMFTIETKKNAQS